MMLSDLIKYSIPYLEDKYEMEINTFTKEGAESEIEKVAERLKNIVEQKQQTCLLKWSVEMKKYDDNIKVNLTRCLKFIPWDSTEILFPLNSLKIRMFGTCYLEIIKKKIEKPYWLLPIIVRDYWYMPKVIIFILLFCILMSVFGSLKISFSEGVSTKDIILVVAIISILHYFKSGHGNVTSGLAEINNTVEDIYVKKYIQKLILVIYYITD